MTDEPDAAPVISVITPIEQAWKRMVRLCFQPFEIGKWFVMGFAVFLAFFGQGGSGFKVLTLIGRGLPGLRVGPSPAEWLVDNLYWLALVILGVLLFCLLIAAVFMWISSRGKFLFIDNVAHNRAAIIEPWKRLARLSNSLFLFRVAAMLFTVTLCLATIGGAGWLAWPDIENEMLTDRGLWAIRLLIIVLVPTVIFYAKMVVIIDDFIVPIMYARDVRCTTAWGEFIPAVLVKRFWVFILFYLMRFVLSTATGSITWIVYCLTCCIARLPYLSAVILLPVFVFSRSYSMYFVQQFTPRWRVFPIDADHPICPACYYDLRGNPQAVSCPECGYLLEPGLE